VTNSQRTEIPPDLIQLSVIPLSSPWPQEILPITTPNITTSISSEEAVTSSQRTEIPPDLIQLSVIPPSSPWPQQILPITTSNITTSISSEEAVTSSQRTEIPPDLIQRSVTPPLSPCPEILPTTTTITTTTMTNNHPRAVRFADDVEGHDSEGIEVVANDQGRSLSQHAYFATQAALARSMSRHPYPTTQATLARSLTQYHYPKTQGGHARPQSRHPYPTLQATLGRHGSPPRPSPIRLGDRLASRGDQPPAMATLHHDGQAVLGSFDDEFAIVPPQSRPGTTSVPGRFTTTAPFRAQPTISTFRARPDMTSFQDRR